MNKLRLIVGAGKYHNRQEWDTTMDINPYPGIDLVHDANLDWPIKDNKYSEVVAIHVVEHLKSLLHFMNESWRVLRPGGELYIETPLAGGNTELEWADPTHIRCFTTYSFYNYFTPEGIAQFGYTDKPWKIIKCHTEPIFPDRSLYPDVVIFRGTPIK